MSSFFSKCILLYLSLQVINAITPIDDLDAAYLVITEAETQYERVDQRLRTDSEKFSALLSRGLHNNTLLAEIQRDKDYIDLSNPLMSELSRIKTHLKQIIFSKLIVNDDQFRKMQSEIQRLLNEHALVVNHTLLRFTIQEKHKKRTLID